MGIQCVLEKLQVVSELHIMDICCSNHKQFPYIFGEEKHISSEKLLGMCSKMDGLQQS